jgi:hypothetical protein
MLPPNQFLELPRGFYHIPVCYHLKDICEDEPDRFPVTKILQDRLYQYRQARGGTMPPPDMEQCRVCPTEFQVEIHEFKRRGKGIVITVWQDFGQILSPFDRAWNVHFFPGTYFGELRYGPSFMGGDIREAFEGTPD